MKKILLSIFLISFTYTNAQTLIKHYTFDGTLYDTTNPLVDRFIISDGSANAHAVNYATGRHGIANSAIDLSAGTSLYSGMSNLPTGTSARSIVMWVKFKDFQFIQYVFSYGTASNGNCFGLTINNYNQLEQYNWGSGYSIIHDFTANAPGDWHHFVISYDSTNIKIYLNGQLLKTQALAINTSNGYFYIGSTPSIFSSRSIRAYIDDLQIYNGALSDAQVTQLYNGASLGVADFQSGHLNASVYPNPVKETLNIHLETELKSVEIYNPQGLKIKSSNQKQVNVSELSHGIYFVRIEDQNSHVVTQKFFKN
ncbi:LamG-like jellyroll fold domain-containing protein [Flavobacterium sp. RS13.1]|uniref:LamG-like jellyroll fold domain-containing protein n=1 Tax=Flavobacterium sp. RS13.1 TaxID=3400345 RepID=UPI003AAE8EC8